MRGGAPQTSSRAAGSGSADWRRCALLLKVTTRCLLVRARVGSTSKTRSSGSSPMKVHIVGGGFGGLAAAAYLIRNAGGSGQAITVYEGEGGRGGACSPGGRSESGYMLTGGCR